MVDKPSGAPESLLAGVRITGRMLLVVEGQDEKQVFLASKPKACLRVGEAASAGCWPFEHPAFDQIRALIERLVAVAEAWSRSCIFTPLCSSHESGHPSRARLNGFVVSASAL